MLRDPEQLMDLRKPELMLSCPEAEGEDGLELSLGLSLGGSYSKSLRRSYSEIGSSKANVVGSRPPLMNGLCSGGTPQWRRELYALRRQEVRRKRQRKAAAIKGRVHSARTCLLDEKTLLEAKEAQSQCRAKDREGRERDPTPAEWRRSSCKTPENVHSSNPNVTTTSLRPAVPLQCSAYQNVQYVPITNGFGLPYMMPCRAPAVSPSGNGTGCMEVNIFQPVACRGFSPFPVPAASSNGIGWKMPGGEVVDTKPTRSSSTGSSSSSISDNQSGSPHGIEPLFL